MNRVVDRDAWRAARIAFLAKEKAVTHARAALAEERRALPCVGVEKPYAFETPDGTRTLRELIGDRAQLLVYHFMFAPTWEAGCKSCSLVAESFDHLVAHLGAQGTAFVAVSRAPLAKLLAYRERLGWSFPWVSSGPSDFNFDLQVSFTEEDVRTGRAQYNYRPLITPQTDLPGFSTFLPDGEDVLHAYSTFGRGVEALMNVYSLLDLTPRGRQEEGRGMAWVRRRDEYGATTRE